MKRFLVVLVLCVCLCLSCTPAFASDAETGEGTTADTPTVIVNNGIEWPVNVLTYYGSSQQPFSASSYNGLKGVLLEFLGEWECITVQHSYVDSSGNSVTQVEVVPDYPWIASAVLLCLMVFCLFRVGGALICKA